MPSIDPTPHLHAQALRLGNRLRRAARINGALDTDQGTLRDEVLRREK